MIIENINLNKVPTHSRITRVCDECGKKETAFVYVVLTGRKVRSANIDLCKHCSNIGKYRKMPTGVKSGHWKHGITKQGYNRINVAGRRMLEHVFVIEKFIGRSLLKGECVHHIDGNKLNNAPDNLYVLKNRSCHRFCHSSLRVCGYALLDKYIYFDAENKTYSLNKCEKYNGLFLTEEDKLYLKNIKTVIGRSLKRRTQTEYFCSYNSETQKQNKKKYHVLLAEKSLKRRLFHGESVHHINGNTLDNRLENLFVLDIGVHIKLHDSMEKCCHELYKQGIVLFNVELGIYTLRA